jgi:hypothetical protein
MWSRRMGNWAASAQGNVIDGLKRAAQRAREMAAFNRSKRRYPSAIDLEAFAVLLDAEADQEDTPPAGTFVCTECAKRAASKL